MVEKSPPNNEMYGEQTNRLTEGRGRSEKAKKTEQEPVKLPPLPKLLDVSD